MNLPEDVKKVESQLTWLDNILSDCFEDSKEKKMEWLEDKLEQIKWQEELDLSWESEENKHPGDPMSNPDLEPRNEDWAKKELTAAGTLQKSNYGALVRRLIKATIAVHVVDYGFYSLDEISRIRDSLEQELPEEYEKIFKKVLEYFLNALEFSIYELLGECPPWHCNFQYLKRTWQEFQEDNKCLVVISYLKASLQKIHPRFREDSSEMERFLQSTFQLGMMLKDGLWDHLKEKNASRDGKDQAFHYSVDLDNMLKRCLSLFDEAIDLAEENNIKDNQWAVESVVQKAKLLRKLGNVYRCGVVDDVGTELVKSPITAFEQFWSALELRQRNYFQCLRDSIKLLKHDPPPLYVTMNLLVHLTRFIKDPEPLMKIGSDNKPLVTARIWRGFVSWLYNPEQDPQHKRKACEDWLYVLENYPDLRQDALKFIWNPELIHIPSKVCTDDLKKELAEIKQEQMKKLAAVDLLWLGGLG